VFVSFAVSSPAQSSIITTHAGSAVPESSAQAITRLTSPVVSSWTVPAVFSGIDQVAVNCQRGTAAPHSVSSGTDMGTWTVTGVRAHQNMNDHGNDFISVSKILTVIP